MMLAREIGHFLVGTMFLTRLPVPFGSSASLHGSEERLARSVRHFPLVGALVGLVSGGVFALAALALPSAVAAGLALAAGLVATGALHEDGLVDCCDGLGGGRTRERSLEIMRDSRIGAFGAAAMVVSLGLRWAALTTLAPVQGLTALIVAHAVSRAMMSPMLVFGRYQRAQGLASPMAGAVTVGDAATAIVLAVVIAPIVGLQAGLLAFAAGVVAAGAMGALLMRRLGGYTGDGLGAIQQCAEIAVLCTLAGALV